MIETATERESFYDSQIAPELARLGQLCMDNGLSLIAVCEFDSEKPDYGRTHASAETRSLPFKFIDLAVRTMPNLDSFVFAVKKLNPPGNPGGSLVLHMLDNYGKQG